MKAHFSKPFKLLKENDLMIYRNLLYSDARTKSEKVKNGKENALIRLHGWFSDNPCVTSTGEILANMYNDK